MTPIHALTTLIAAAAPGTADGADHHPAVEAPVWSALDLFADGLALVCLCGGLFFLFVGAVGMVRLPDAFHRLHAISKCSTLGLMGLCLAAVFHVGTIAVAAKATLTIVFAFVATPVGSHILARSALMANQPLWEGTIENERPNDQATDADETPDA